MLHPDTNWICELHGSYQCQNPHRMFGNCITGKFAERKAPMQKIVHSRLICILMMISVLVLGIYCENVYTDSSFSCAGIENSTVFLRSADSLADIHIYCEKSSLRLIQESVLTRQSARVSAMRLSQCLITVLLLVSMYLLSLSFRNSALCIVGYDNQCNRRTLDYIHHNDGKKSRILF